MKPAFFLVALLLSACSSYQPSSAPETSGPSRMRSADGETSSLQKQKERPGLATGWGDQRSSLTHDTDFVRASSKPYGTDAIYYNNRDGMPSSRPTNPVQEAANGIVEWGIKGKSRFLTTYQQGSGQRMVQGQKGENYSIFVRNRSMSDLEIVASVDGLDVIDGRPASYSKRGYVIAPGKTLDIKGFRTSREAVAAFKFSSVSDSYANLRHADTRNVGVIGIAVFTQKGVDPWQSADAKLRKNARPFAEAP